MTRIRVLHVVTRLVQRGVPRHVLEMAAGLDSDRFDVEVLAGKGEENEGSLLEEARQRGITATYIPSLVRPIRPRSEASAYRAIARKIRGGRYHVVHTHISKAGILGRWAAARARTPLIVHTYHGRVEEVHDSTLRGRVLLGCERAAARRTDSIVAVSTSTAELCLEKGIGTADQYSVIHNGIDPARFTGDIGRLDLPAQLQGKAIIGAIASLTSEKGIDVLLAAIPSLLREHPELHLVILGDGELRQPLHDLAGRLGLTDRVWFMGNVADVRPWVKVFQVMVIPSRREGLPTVLLEAMALGCPVVASAVGGIPELLLHGTTGLLVPPDDVEALTESTAALLTDGNRRSAFAVAALGRIRDDFTLDQSIAKLEQLYESQLRIKHVEA